MNHYIWLSAAMGLASCTEFAGALNSLDRELDDGMFVVRSEIGDPTQEGPGEIYHLVRIAEDRTGSTARFEALGYDSFAERADFVLESQLSVSPDGNFMAYSNLEAIGSVEEFNLGLYQVAPLRSIDGGTDDILASRFARTCGYDGFLRDQIIQDLSQFFEYDGESPVIISYAEQMGGVEWRIGIAGWTPDNTPVFEVDVYMDWTAEWVSQDGEDLLEDGFGATATVFVTLDTQRSIGNVGGLSILACSATRPSIAADLTFLYNVSRQSGGQGPSFLIDGAPLQTFLRPDEPFRMPRLTNPQVATGVFVPQ